MKNLATCLCLLLFWINNAQELEVKAQVRHTIDELREFIAIPNDALDHSDINRNLSWLTKKFNERGFNSSVLPTEGESLFFAALPMLAACYALFVMRDEDTMFAVEKKKEG